MDNKMQHLKSIFIHNVNILTFDTFNTTLGSVYE